MKRLLILFALLGMISGATYAQPSSKNTSHVKIIADGGYYLSSGTPSGSMGATLAARKFGCGASSCTVVGTAEKQFLVVFGAEKLKQEKIMSAEQLQKNGFQAMPLEDYLMKYSDGLKSKDKKQGDILMGDKKGQLEKEDILNEKVNSKMRLMLNFQSLDSHQQAELIGLLKKMIKAYSMHDKVEFSSSDLMLCRALALNFKETPVTYMQGDLSPKEISKRVGKIGCRYDYATLQDHPNWLKEAKNSGMPVVVSKVRNEQEVRDMLERGVDCFMTENVAMVSAWAEKKPLVKLMSFNIRMSGMPKYDGVNAWENRKEAVVRMFKEQNPDVVGVQEMLPDQQEYLRKALRDYSMVGLGRDDGRKEGECMGIFYKTSRFALKDSGTFWLSQTPDMASLGWDAACKRTVTYVQLKDMQSGRSFYYFNTHLDHVGMIARQESVKLICEKIREIVRDTNSVFILGGDMNSPISDHIFIPLLGDPTKEKKTFLDIAENKKQVLEMTEGRTDALMKICRYNAWQRDNSITYNGYGKERVSQIDHLFSSCTTENLIFQTVRKDYGVPYISDHYPITLIFSLK